MSSLFSFLNTNARPDHLRGIPPEIRTTESVTNLPSHSLFFMFHKVIPRENLPVQMLARLDFGKHLLSVLGLAETVKLAAAKNLPPVPAAGKGETNANAFRNSYLWEMSTGVLCVHGTYYLADVRAFRCG